MFLKYKFFIAVLLGIFFIPKISAQDVHFSQFDLSPMYISPALTGYMENGTDRIAIKYRNQWSAVLPNQGYKTYFASYDGRSCLDHSSNFFGYGISAMEDRAGDPVFKTSQYQAAFSYHMQLTTGYFLSLGLQSGLLRYQINPMDFDFDNEYDGGLGFINSPNTPLELLNDDVRIWDVGGGALFYNPDNSWNIGLSFQHGIKQGFFAFTPTGVEDDNKVNTRWILHTSIPVPFGKKGQHYLVFKGMTKIQRPHWQFVGGSDFRLRISKDRSQTFFRTITVGLALRLSDRPDQLLGIDSGILSAKTAISPNMTLGLGYDMNISNLQNKNRSVGGLELSLVIVLTAPKKNDCIDCFKFDTIKKGKKQKQRTLSLIHI